MKKINEIVTSTEKPQERAKRKAVTFGSFKRAEEKQIEETKKRKQDEELTRIVEEARIKQAIQERNARIDREIREEEERVIKEEAKRKRSEFITESISNAFGTKTEVDYKPVREKVIEQYLPQLREQETLDNLPKPFEAEPALNAELEEFKKKINEHIHKVGFASGGGGIDPNKISDHLIPTVDNTFDLGAADRQWRNLYLSGSTLIVDGTSIDSGELTALDGVTAGTVSASKAVIVDANKDITGFRNVTGGTLTSTGNVVIADAGNIGSASDTDAIAIAANGVVTFSQAPVFPDGSIDIADINLDGGTDIGAAIVDDDLFLIDDGADGTMRKTAASRLKTYIGAGAADDLQAGDAAVTLTTTSGNITIDAQANDSDIIFKGTDGSADTTFLTIDGSAAGKATFNNEIVSGAVITSGAGLVIADDGNIGSASDTDAIAIAANGVVTFSQVPVLPNDTVETNDIQDNAVTPAKIAGAVNAQTGTTYTLVLADAFKTVTSSNGSAQTITIPLNSSVAFATGDRVDIVMLGSGTTSVTGASGVTVNGVNGGTGAISAQYAAVSCLKIASDTWILMGNHGGVS